ncbi:hypothetical protein [Methylobacterium radiodurans]|uniref:Uncharacterized protein n=1 Tax=Methylobacterium radiodurans TaxID=2202828 RepID=A0A2U8VLB8_9HYPH|nr:hypothetical protein [Methylobacterium radiodurans]AWN34393.1 hypothetical protein DK427_00405 [Methylobacterium radiodurans]
MTEGFGPSFHRLIADLATDPGALVSEDADVCRVNGARCADAALLNRLAKAARAATEGGYGTLEVHGAVMDAFDPASTPFEDVEGEILQVILRKASAPGWRYFVTCGGFASSLSDELASAPLAIWVCEPFEPFSALTMSVSPWGGERTPPEPQVLPERPRKLVRDLTYGRTPPLVGPWLLASGPAVGSDVFDAWAAVAVEKLAYVLPYEVRFVDDEVRVVVKGPRTTPVAVVPMTRDWPSRILEPLTEAATWVYAAPREAEARFLFLNNHLSLDWRDGLHWPDGLLHLLRGSLASAREAYAFHLQDQSKDALKTLGDLRKSLQDEVARAQAATRDLLSSLWRDFAVAGVVLALKSPTASQITSAEVLRWVTLATAVLLVVSLVMTVVTNARFNKLADDARGEWRKKLYAFVSETEWIRLVESPIRRGRIVYRCALPIVGVLYLAAAAYLVAVVEPGWAVTVKDALSGFLSRSP